MIKFFVQLGSNLKECTAESIEKAQEFLKLIFIGKRAFVVDGDVVKFALNMTLQEAEELNPYKKVKTPPAPPATVVRASVPKKNGKPKKTAKKTVVKSKVKAKKSNKAKIKPKKVKLKVKPKAKKVKVKMKPKVKVKSKR